MTFLRQTGVQAVADGSVSDLLAHWIAEQLHHDELARRERPRIGIMAASGILRDGGWPIYPGGPAEVSSSVKAYFVLKLLGDDPATPHMEKARTVIQRLGGVEACNSFTKIYLAIFGQYPWARCPGVPPEIRATLFEPFVTARKKGGTGLGLAVARRFVEDHGGTIELAPESGPDAPSGARFRMSIPLVPAPGTGVEAAAR